LVRALARQAVRGGVIVMRRRWHGVAEGRWGRRPKYSEAAIQFCLTIKSLFNLSLR